MARLPSGFFFSLEKKIKPHEQEGYPSKIEKILFPWFSHKFREDRI